MTDATTATPATDATLAMSAMAATTYSPEQLAGLVPFPAPDSNKYTRGKLVLVVGSESYSGAAYLAAVAGQRAGAGYCEMLTDHANVRIIRQMRPSLVVRSWESFGENRDPQPSMPGKPVAYVVGSGFDGRDSQACDKLEAALRAQAPVLVDGGALGMLASEWGLEALQERADAGLLTVVTPHGGEAAALAEACYIDVPAAASASDANSVGEFAARLAESLGAVVCLKGPVTYVATPEGNLARMDEGTAALAKAGTGDVLAGVIGALLAQGLDGMDAAVLGATLHARAGRLAAETYTEIGVCPEDVLECLPFAFKTFSIN